MKKSFLVYRVCTFIARTARRYVLSAAKSVVNARTASYAPIVETV